MINRRKTRKSNQNGSTSPHPLCIRLIDSSILILQLDQLIRYYSLLLSKLMTGHFVEHMGGGVGGRLELCLLLQWCQLTKCDNFIILQKESLNARP
jgi:hypothetical protein